MESTKSVMINISKYLSSVFRKAALETFKDYLPENLEDQVVCNSLGISDLTSPLTMKIYNLCNKKENWKYLTSKEVGEELIKNIKDEKSIIEETKIEQEIDKKKNKKEKRKSKYQTQHI